MSTIEASTLLRPGLLNGVGVLVVGGAGETGAEGFGDAVESVCESLGAEVLRCPALGGLSPERQEAATDAAVAAALADLRSIDMLVVDAEAILTCERSGAEDPRVETGGAELAACLQAAWTVTRAVFNLAFAQAQGGRTIYLAPRSDPGGHPDPVLAGLENLSRTLSVEWSRNCVTALTIAPGAVTPAHEVAELAAYLASPAGAYFSGCLLDLRGLPA